MITCVHTYIVTIRLRPTWELVRMSKNVISIEKSITTEKNVCTSRAALRGVIGPPGPSFAPPLESINRHAFVLLQRTHCWC